MGEAAIDDATWVAYTEHKRAAAEYARNWWRADAGVVSRCRSDRRLQRELEILDLVTTADVYEDDDHAWAPERQRLHSALVGEVEGDGPARVTPRQAYLLAGPPGAGKSSVLTRMVTAHRKHLGLGGEALAVVSSDDVREHLPEYASGLGSSVVQEEASYVAYRLQYPQARSCGADLVIDSIGRAVYLKRWAEELAADGFEVHVLAVHVEPDTAVQRMRQRAVETGRTVPTDVVRDAAGATRDLLVAASDQSWPLASIVLVDNTVERGSAPRVVDGSPTWGASGGAVELW